MNYTDIPNINRLLELSSLTDVEPQWALELSRAATELVRQGIQEGSIDSSWTMKQWNDCIGFLKIQRSQKRYRPVINATGIVVHTNLGRAPLSPEVVEYMMEVSGYTDLELRLKDGKRGGRLDGIRSKLRTLTGAEDALVVNNNSAAVLLVLSTLATNKEVVVSRGELVEIGGSFRIPDVIQQGGATLKEVGCTNRTRVADFESVLSEHTGAILRVHPSNYRIIGFAERPSRTELSQLAKSRGIPLVDDLGSGLLRHAPNVPWKEELEREESIALAIEQGVDLVCASGDKLLGGVQSGLIVGRADLVERCRKHPLYRALRLDKLMLAGLEATLQMHLQSRSSQLLTWKFLERTKFECRELATQLAEGLPMVTIRESYSMVGGGALPERKLSTWVVAIQSKSANDLAMKLRTGHPAIMTRIHKASVFLDVRTLLEKEIPLVRKRLLELLDE